MDNHPYFDLLLHSDAELTAHLGDAIIERVTLHEWPLSCVQRVTTAGGRRLIYKSQTVPSVESAFYAAARSHLLVEVETLFETERHSVLLIEWIDVPPLSKMDLSGLDVVDWAERIVKEIGQIEGEPVVYQAIGGADWPVFVAEVLDELARLIRSGSFRSTPLSLLDRLQAWSYSASVLALAQSDSRLIHADLSGDNLFLVDGGPLVIDWQYPRSGPPALDLATLLLALGVDPRPLTPPATVEMLYFVRLGWLVACAARWFPPGAETYEQQIARLTTQIINAPESSGKQ